MHIHEEDLAIVAPVSKKLLDFYLAKGFYRYAQSIFTTYYIQYENLFYDVFWLRTIVADVKLSNTAKKITNQNKQFTYTISPLEITSEMEDLFSIYRNNVSFDHAENIRSNLFGNSNNNLFESYVIKIYDGNLLIAFGCFDKGENSITGILNAYHPNYKKYSLGKYLILLKLNYCATNNIKFYYTGYIAIGLKCFDYKVFPDADAVEVFLHQHQNWEKYNQYKKIGLAQNGFLAEFLRDIGLIDNPT